MKDYDLVTSAILSEAPSDEIADLILENQFREERIENQMVYAMLIEQFLDSCSVYAYEGWDDAQIYGAPVINSYNVEITLLLPPNTNKRSFTRLAGTNKENRVSVSKVGDDGKIKLELVIRRGLLDSIEEENRQRARKIADEQGYKPQEEQPQQQNPMGSGAPGAGMTPF